MIEQLLEYQKIDMELNKIEKKIKDSDERKKYLNIKIKVNTITEEMNKADKDSAKLLDKYKKIEENISSLNEKVAEYCKVSKDLKEEHEIDYCLSKINPLKDELDNLYKELGRCERTMDKIVKTFNDTQKSYAEAIARYKKAKDEYAKFKTTFENEVNKYKTEMKKLAEKIDKEYIDKYENLRKINSLPVIVPLEKNICTGCYVGISPNTMSKFNNSKIVECPNCSRIIYIKE